MTRTSNVAAFAVTPDDYSGGPRIIQQFKSIFLVSRSGDLWRVYDCATPMGTDRGMPSPHSTQPHRLFLSLAQKTMVRVHTFVPGESRDTSAPSLQRQLDVSTPE